MLDENLDKIINEELIAMLGLIIIHICTGAVLATFVVFSFLYFLCFILFDLVLTVEKVINIEI